MKHHLSAMAAAITLAISGNAFATPANLPATSNGYALWDSFAAITFSNAAPGASSTSLFTADLSSSMAPPAQIIPGGPGDNRLYSNVSSFNLTIAGTFNAEVEDFTIRMKFTTPAPPATILSYFTATSSSFGATTPTKTNLGSFSEASGTYNIVEFTWNDVNMEAGENFSVNVTSAANSHVSLDAVQAVPEPTVATLALVGGIAMMLRRRRSNCIA